MTTVIVGVDASERSRDAVAFTHLLARASGATVLVASIYCYEDRPSRAANAGYRRALERDAADAAAAAAATLADLGEARVRTVVRGRSSAAQGLQELAEAEQAALVVLGSSHVGAGGRVMPGGTAERLLHGSPCPVAIVPRGYHGDEPMLRRIGVAHDGTAESDAALAAAVALARAAAGELRVIRIADARTYASPALMGGPSQVRAWQEVERACREEHDAVLAGLPADVRAEGAFVVGDPVRTLAEQTGTLDLLITGSRRYGPLRAVMLGGVSGRVLRDAACPVIVVPRGVPAPLETLFAAAEARA